jgi:hypothetical protein
MSWVWLHNAVARVVSTALRSLSRRNVEMARDVEAPFGSLESAYQYVGVLADVAAEAQRDILDDINVAGAADDRRLQALQLVDYKLTQLRRNLDTAHRLLNDLRSLRRLLLGERRALRLPDRSSQRSESASVT